MALSVRIAPDSLAAMTELFHAGMPTPIKIPIIAITIINSISEKPRSLRLVLTGRCIKLILLTDRLHESTPRTVPQTRTRPKRRSTRDPTSQILLHGLRGTEMQWSVVGGQKKNKYLSTDHRPLTTDHCFIVEWPPHETFADCAGRGAGDVGG